MSVVVVLSTAAEVLFAVNFGRFRFVSVPAVIGFYLLAFAITTSFAVWTASSLRLPSLLALSSLPSGRRWARFALYGIGGGVVLFLTNRALYLLHAVSTPLQPWYAGSLDSHAGVLILSVKSAFSEETFFRLFSIPFLVSVGMRLRYGWRPRFSFETGTASPLSASPGDSVAPTSPPIILVAIAVLTSALLFGLHHPFNPLPSVGFGLVLALIYLRAGWESAVAAHFLANYLLFLNLCR